MATHPGMQKRDSAPLDTGRPPVSWPFGVSQVARGRGGSGQRCPASTPNSRPLDISSCPFFSSMLHRPHSEGEHDLSIISNSTPTVQPQTCTTSPNGLEVPRSYARRYCVQADNLTSTFKNYGCFRPEHKKDGLVLLPSPPGPRPRGPVSHISSNTSLPQFKIN